MRIKINLKILSIATVIWSTVLPLSAAQYPDESQCHQLWDQKTNIKPEIEGCCLFIEKNRGNCVSCHGVNIKNWPSTLGHAGNIGPYLDHQSLRSLKKNQIVEIINDASASNPRTIMPLYGKNLILNTKEIEIIADFLLSID